MVWQAARVQAGAGVLCLPAGCFCVGACVLATWHLCNAIRLPAGPVIFPSQWASGLEERHDVPASLVEGHGSCKRRLGGLWLVKLIIGGSACRTFDVVLCSAVMRHAGSHGMTTRLACRSSRDSCSALRCAKPKA